MKVTFYMDKAQSREVPPDQAYWVLEQEIDKNGDSTEMLYRALTREEMRESWITLDDGRHVYLPEPGETPLAATHLRKASEEEKASYRSSFKRQPAKQGYEIRQLSDKELDYVLTDTKFAFISGGPNKYLDPENANEDFYKARTMALEKELVNQGYVYTPVVGHYYGREDSFLVMAHDADREDFKRIGIQFNQQSIVYSDHGKNEMIQVTDGDYPAGSVWDDKGYELIDPPEGTDSDNLYTEIPLRGYSVVKLQLKTGYDGSKPPMRKEYIEGWVTIDGVHVLIGDEDTLKTLDYEVSPISIQTGTSTEDDVRKFNRDFKMNYDKSELLYRGVGSEKAIDDALENNVVRNLTPGAPVSFTINPKVAQEFAQQKEMGAVLVFDKAAIAENIIVPEYQHIDKVDPDEERFWTDRLPTKWAYQEEVRGTNVKLKAGALKEIRVSTMKAYFYYREKYGGRVAVSLIKKVKELVEWIRKTISS